MQASRTDRRHLSEAPMSPRRHKVPRGITLGHTLATLAALAQENPERLLGDDQRRDSGINTARPDCSLDISAHGK